MRQITPNLWINDGPVEDAVAFWCSVLPDSKVVSSVSHGPDAGDLAGQTMAVNFVLQGQPFTAINGGGTRFEPSEAVSLAVPCDTQDEIDQLWDAFAEGGEPGPCGWVKDRYGFSWQVYPAVLDEMMNDPDPARVQRVVACFMQIDGRAFDIAELQAAYDGA
jgi:predicted 3-demethylubiquinone-9 3-methyltransferase (glyoxalase superfamily)